MQESKMILPTDAQERKNLPITTGVLDYFPRAIAAVALCSKMGNDQHHRGLQLHWDKTKSTDHADCIARHLVDRTAHDEDKLLHAAKLAWRALALLETMLDDGYVVLRENLLSNSDGLDVGKALSELNIYRPKQPSNTTII